MRSDVMKEAMESLSRVGAVVTLRVDGEAWEVRKTRHGTILTNLAKRDRIAEREGGGVVADGLS